MNKGTLIDFVANDKDADFDSRAAAERAVNAVLRGIAQGLTDKKGEKKVQIIGFGTFTVKARKARTGRNPQTGESMKIKASKSVGFKPGKELKDKL